MKSPYRKKDLFVLKAPAALTGENRTHVAFPLGGIGAGSVALGGWGQLRDWEIRNRPAKGATVNDTFFTLKARVGNKAPVVKVLQGPPTGDFGFHGHSAPNAAGDHLPHFRRNSFLGTFPVATVTLEDEQVPLKVSLEAFSPFIPLNEKDSSLPAAVLVYRLHNPGRSVVTGTVYGNLRNRIGDREGQTKPPERVNEKRAEKGLTGLRLSAGDIDPASPRYGSMALATCWPDADVCPRWKTDQLLKFWDMVTGDDQLPQNGKGYVGTVAARFSLKPGETAVIPFFLTWYFPNFEWYPGADCAGNCCCAPDTKKPTWKNYYATVWSDAWDVARYTAAEYPRLREETIRFRDALFSSTLPPYVLDAVSSQISTLKTATCLRLTDGTFYASEGCSDTEGCCGGSCTHVWNYAQALPYLFPKLQRSMRQADYTHAMRDDGAVEFRIPLPIGTRPTWKFPPAADGQMGTVIQVYREWLISGDREWLKKMWPLTKKALEFAWVYWDPNKDGVMEGVQHNTYDIEYYGPNPFSGILYLGALRAAEEMARVMGEPAKAAEYHGLFAKGSNWMDRNLFNGEYYEQKVNPKALDLIPDTDSCKEGAVKREKDDKFPDWPQWQLGKGCLSDQLMGQWYARMVGLGSLLDQTRVRKAARAIFRYNWRTDFTDHAALSAPRIYAANEEKGLLTATWPRGGRPGYPSLYADEVWTGIEYEAAAALIYEGLLEEGLSIVRGARERYSGLHRNPWDEIECGHHYARPMSSYSLLPALSGFLYSAADGHLAFAPRLNERDFTVFFSVGSGWGRYRQRATGSRWTAEVAVEYGRLELSSLRLGLKRSGKVTARCGGRQVPAAARRTAAGSEIVFAEPVTIEQGKKLVVSL